MNSDTCYGVRLVADGAGDPDGGENMSVMLFIRWTVQKFVNRLDMIFQAFLIVYPFICPLRLLVRLEFGGYIEA